MTSPRPSTTCAWCGRACRSERRVCSNCVGVVAYPTKEHESADALTGGEWRLDPKTRVLRWVQVVPEPDPIVDLIACPTCRAKVTETCRTRKGHRTSDHPNRILKRRCECGGELRPRARWCLPCAAERKRSWGKSEVAA